MHYDKNKLIKTYIELNELGFELLFTRMEKVDCIHVRATKTHFLNTLPLCTKTIGFLVNKRKTMLSNYFVTVVV